MADWDTIVVGAGAMGAACAWRLARLGQRVLVLEANSIPNTVGSSHGDTRITRTAYFEHPDYVPLIRFAKRLWLQAQAESDATLYHETGALYAGVAGSELLVGSQRSAAEHGLDLEPLSRAEIGRRYPRFRLPEGFDAFFEADAGILRPECCVSAMLALAAGLGAEFHAQEAVTEWGGSSSEVVVRTGHGSYTAESVVFCAGAWAAKLLPELACRLTVTRQVAVWVDVPDDPGLRLGQMPVWAAEEENGVFSYGFPVMPERPGLKTARHNPGAIVDADTDPRRATVQDEETIRPALGRFWPSLVGPVVEMSVCLYTNSADGHFILDRLPGTDNAWVVTGCSGHGFKFAPVLGDAIASWVVSGDPGHPVEFLSLGRFTG